MESLFNTIVTIATTITLGVTGFLNITPPPQILPTPTPPPYVTMIYAKGNYVFDKHTVSVSLSFPEEGGAVRGTIEGSCNGTIEGTYIQSNDLTGKGEATCAYGPFKVKAKASLTGSINIEKKTGTLHIVAEALNYKKEGTVPLTLEY
jgi:hypothetical protein